MPPGMDMNSMAAMMENPMMQQMMQGMLSQPGMLESMVNANPMMRNMMDGNPMMR